MSCPQSRAARALLGWTQADLARASGLNKRTVMDAESGAKWPRPSTLAKLAQALENAGVELIAAGDDGGDGVRLRIGADVAGREPERDCGGIGGANP